MFSPAYPRLTICTRSGSGNWNTWPALLGSLLYTEGTSGHISVRDPVDPDTFWINPLGKHFGMLKASDMVQVNEQGQVIGGNKTAVNAAGFMIHSAIHRARPDIHAACHTHSPFGKAWSTFGKPLDIISQDTCNFWGTQVVYEMFGGVVLEQDESEKIAQALGDKGRIATLQNHVQLLVEATGLEKRLIGEKEAEFTAKVNADPETLYTEFQPDFEYEIWKSNGELTKGEY
ncbi:hypothetical protein QQZ08_005187 [Neonectria magnoliae]|uniref:Class II aldolase/adducin N-terminal domain-containing protein n=1 Tax=Neonectria magnoliae TaxID=2732573 RepID=A0ABR1I484_9HYPO